MGLVLARMRDENLNAALAVRQQMEAVTKAFELVREHPELRKEDG